MKSLITNTLNALPAERICYLSRGGHWLLKTILTVFGGLVSIENLSNLKAVSGPVIFALNHNNYLESLLVPSILIHLRNSEKISFVIDWMFGRLPVIGYLLKQIDPIYVYNKPSKFYFLSQYSNQVRRNRVIPECIAKLANNRSIGIFPEGTRNSNPFQLLKAHNGIGAIVLKSGAPVVPIGIDFPNRQNLKKLPELGRLILRIGEPLNFQDEITLLQKLYEIPNFPKNDYSKVELYLSSKITTTVMTEISRLSGKFYPYPAASPPSCLGQYDHSQKNKGGD